MRETFGQVPRRGRETLAEREIVVTAPERVQLVVTSLVPLEWSQNKDEVGAEATEWLADTDRRILEIHRTWDRVGSPWAVENDRFSDGIGLAESEKSVALFRSQEGVFRFNDPLDG